MIAEEASRKKRRESHGPCQKQLAGSNRRAESRVHSDVSSVLSPIITVSQPGSVPLPLLSLPLDIPARSFIGPQQKQREQQTWRLQLVGWRGSNFDSMSAEAALLRLLPAPIRRSQHHAPRSHHRRIANLPKQAQPLAGALKEGSVLALPNLAHGQPELSELWKQTSRPLLLLLPRARAGL